MASTAGTPRTPSEPAGTPRTPSEPAGTPRTPSEPAGTPRERQGGHEVLCVGETMALVAPAEPIALEEASSFTLSAGGAESNVAIHLAGLGHDVGWVSRVGNDPLGRRLVAAIASAGVDTGLVEVYDQAPTGVYFKNPGADGTMVHYYRTGSAASTMDEYVASRVLGHHPKLVHLSGITPALSGGCDRLVRAVLGGSRSSTVAFDVNYRPALWPVEQAGPRLRELADQADIVFVGLDEAATLWGVTSPDEVRETLRRPRTVVVKDAAHAAYALGSSITAVPAPKVEVVEPVGAGDAFAAGFLSGSLRGHDPTRCLRLGHILAAHSLLSTEDHTALPDPGAVEGWLSCDEDAWAALHFGAR